MRHNARRSPIAIGLFVLLTASTSPVAGATMFPDGAKSLFAGHSFFVPIAASFDQLATTNGYSSHEFNSVFSPGASGSPLALWDDESDKAAIVDVLDEGDVELFALTAVIGPNGTTSGSDVEDYARWFDLALSYNPDTQFLIGMPWVVAGPTPAFSGAEEFAAANETTAALQRETVEDLRAAYPDATIHYIEYGLVASIMYDLYEQGQLPDITGLTPDPANGVPPSDVLFADPLIGHGGPMMTELTALVWMELLYGANLESLTFTEYRSDVEAIVAEVVAHNQQFLVVPEPGGEVALAAALAALLPATSRRRRA